jgi:hypothetical protein
MDQRLGSSSRDFLPVPVRGGVALTTQQRQTVDLSGNIRGWGSDLDPARRPGVPRDKAPEIGVETLYPPIEQQVPKIKIHKSTEHGRLTPVFGTSCPPFGVSGRIRDFGYTFSEGRNARWMTLMLADRVNVVEDVLLDLAEGRVPNIPKEMGLASEFRYNRTGLAGKALVAGVCIGAILAYSRSRRKLTRWPLPKSSDRRLATRGR